MPISGYSALLVTSLFPASGGCADLTVKIVLPKGIFSFPSTFGPACSLPASTGHFVPW